ncbi:SCO family protein [Rickettsiella massiliensis]|uniref:SCO family protein n=1 Tax=Rickettsiella massiliensis TaxID=676517 RepID=UPI00029B3DCC|nr:SCO family protein [Rickettsiella massiliensis]
MFDSSANKNRLLLILSLIALLFGSRVNTWYRTHQATTLSFSGIMIQKPLVVPAFELQDEAKQRFTQKNLHGQYNFLFFGYTHCRGICSLTMMKLTELYKQIQIKKLPIPRILFISLDPKHDKPAILRNYVQAFHPAFKGESANGCCLYSISRR